jgi:hypothetical protein
MTGQTGSPSLSDPAGWISYQHRHNGQHPMMGVQVRHAIDAISSVGWSGGER